jgi:hypothetical protein
LPSFPRASTISSSSRFVVEGVFRNPVVVNSLKTVDSVLFVFGSHVLYSRAYFEWKYYVNMGWNILVYNSNMMHKSQSLFNLTAAVTCASCWNYTLEYYYDARTHEH